MLRSETQSNGTHGEMEPGKIVNPLHVRSTLDGPIAKCQFPIVGQSVGKLCSNIKGPALRGSQTFKIEEETPSNREARLSPQMHQRNKTDIGIFGKCIPLLKSDARNPV